MGCFTTPKGASTVYHFDRNGNDTLILPNGGYEFSYTIKKISSPLTLKMKM